MPVLAELPDHGFVRHGIRGSVSMRMATGCHSETSTGLQRLRQEVDDLRRHNWNIIVHRVRNERSLHLTATGVEAMARTIEARIPELTGNLGNGERLRRRLFELSGCAVTRTVMPL